MIPQTYRLSVVREDPDGTPVHYGTGTVVTVPGHEHWQIVEAAGQALLGAILREEGFSPEEARLEYLRAAG